MNARDVNDFVPLMILSISRLRRLQRRCFLEANHIPHGNRIYFFSETLSVSPFIVAKYFSTHIFMFDINRSNFFANLKVFLEYNVAPLNILRDLWAFRYMPHSIRVRLDRAKEANKNKIMPWMVRCPEPILEKY